jgi:hypothetical protein
VPPGGLVFGPDAYLTPRSPCGAARVWRPNRSGKGCIRCQR